VAPRALRARAPRARAPRSARARSAFRACAPLRVDAFEALISLALFNIILSYFTPTSTSEINYEANYLGSMKMIQTILRALFHFLHQLAN